MSEVTKFNVSGSGEDAGKLERALASLKKAATAPPAWRCHVGCRPLVGRSFQ